MTAVNSMYALTIPAFDYTYRFRYAIQNANESEMKICIANGVDIHQRTGIEERTWLGEALIIKDIAKAILAIDLLIDLGAEPDSLHSYYFGKDKPTLNYHLSLDFPCAKVEVVQHAISRGVNVNKRYTHQIEYTPLSRAIKRVHIGVINCLIYNGAVIDDCARQATRQFQAPTYPMLTNAICHSMQYYTGIMHAFNRALPSLVHPEINDVDKAKLPTQLIYEYCKNDILERCYTLEQNALTRLMFANAIEQGDTEQMQELIDEGISVNYRLPIKSWWPTIFEIDDLAKTIATAQFLIDKGARPNLIYEVSYPAIDNDKLPGTLITFQYHINMEFAKAHPEVIAYFIDAGVDINQGCFFWNTLANEVRYSTPLRGAITSGNRDVIRKFAYFGAVFEGRNPEETQLWHELYPNAIGDYQTFRNQYLDTLQLKKAQLNSLLHNFSFLEDEDGKECRLVEIVQEYWMPSAIELSVNCFYLYAPPT